MINQNSATGFTKRQAFPIMVLLISLLSFSNNSSAQLGIYEFTGSGACPTQNPSVTTQPAKATFSDWTTVNANCNASDDVCQHEKWNKGGAIDLNEYHQFSITADAGYALKLNTLGFTQSVSENGSGSGTGNTKWILRSSIDNYTSNISTGSSNDTKQTPVVTLPAGSFSGVSSVTFRLYITTIKDDQTIWMIDDVNLDGSVIILPADPSDPVSNAPQCSNPGVTLTATGSAPAGETWYWQTAATGTSTANSGSTYVVNTAGTYYIRSQDNTTLAWSAGAGSVTVTVTSAVSAPVFASGANSTRCQGANTVSYTATATNSTGITYSLSAASLAAGNTIDPITGDVTFVAGYVGTSVITATAAGCNGPVNSTHSVVTGPSVTIPNFTLGATTTRCQGSGNVTYTANATNTTGITYSLDAASLAGGVTINASNGQVSYNAGWSGTTIISASAAGCNGPATAIHTVTVTPTVGTPVFALGSGSFRCLGGGTGSYTATSTNSTGITYSLDNLSILGGNSINAATGVVTFSALWLGATTITAKATGCNGPVTSTHTVTINANVSTPNFAAGAASTRCQAAGTVNYNAAAANSSGITYSLDATSLAGGNTINSTTGDVTWAAGWSGSSVITASAAGCAGPKTATHTVTTTPPVGTPVFTLGSNSTRCQAATITTYSASATNTTGITYLLDATSLSAGNSINPSTGAVAFVAGWTGTSTITAQAAGCSGPKSATHTVTTSPIVGSPAFTLGATSTRCQAAGTVNYLAGASNTTGITFSLDATSLGSGNTINASTGDVTFTAGWTGNSTITASAAGCGGPKTTTHIVTTNPTIGTPVFTLGSTSSRTQSNSTVTYSATAAYTTAITYTLDAASLAGGNTIVASTGAVTYAANWSGTTVITATATGCGGPKTATHIVTVNSNVVYKQLYLSDPAQSLDRIDPVATADATISSTPLLSTIGLTNTSFTMAPALCDSLRIKAGTITVRTYITISSGTMPAIANVNAVLTYAGNPIITLTNPSYVGGMLTWTGTLASDVLVNAGQTIAIQFTTAQAGVTFRIDFDSQTKPSRIDIPVSTYIQVTSLGVFNAVYPGGAQVFSGVGSSTKYIRATVTDPFGATDITALNVKITPTGSTFPAAIVNTNGCTRTFEYVWNTPATGGSYALSATAKEGYENTVVHTMNASYDICSNCPPVALNDSVSGAGGNPIVVDALANDYDPNNNINPASLAIVGQPGNGSAYISNNNIIYLPNGTFSGKDTITYQICDLSSPSPLCTTGKVFFTIDPFIVDICADASKSHTYYIPYPENEAYDALLNSSNTSMPSNNLRTVISIKVPYQGMVIVWDEWEDGYEANALNPTQATTKVWGDGNPYNGIAPGYPSDLIPASANIVLDNTMPANPRTTAIFYDGKDKVTCNGQIAITQVTGEPTRMPVQAIKTNVTSTYDFGQSFTIPLGQNFPSQDFKYTALFIRAAENNTVVSIDKDNNGTLETTATLQEGQTLFVDGGVMTGATVTSTKPVGVELNAGGVDQYSIRNAPIYPATWYSNTYYTPVPTSDNIGDNPKDSSVVMFYNSLNRPLAINWYSGAPANGVINVPAKSAVRFPLAYSATATYKFVNLTGESFTAIEIVDSYTPYTGTQDGSTYDWSFNLISEARLTDYTTVAWAPGGLDLVAPAGPDVNGNPIWVTPTANTTIYVKYDGNVTGTSGSVSPCGLRYDISYNVNALNYIKILDNTDNDQSGIAIYTCNGAKIAAVYGEDPKGSTTGIGIAYWDVGSTLQPFCKEKVVVASDDFASTLVNQPVTISVLVNDFGFLATIDPTSVSTLGLLQPKHGTLTINPNGTILYIPNNGYTGQDTFDYRVCSTPSPIVCDNAKVIVKISSCPSNGNQNVISGQVYLDRDKDGNNDDGGIGLAAIKVYLYTDGNCNGTLAPNELSDSVIVDNSGFYQFTKYPERTVEDDFEGTNGASSCATGSDGDTPWTPGWTDNGDTFSSGFCNNGASTANTDVEIVKDGAFGYGIRLKDNNVSATRSVNLSGATKAFLTFTYRRKSSTINAGDDVYVQAALNGSTYTTIYTILGDGTTDANYVTVFNQDITSYAGANTAIRFLTANSNSDADTVYIGSVSIRYLKYPQCYITAIDTTTIPNFYKRTTSYFRTMTIGSGSACSSQADFGITKNSITVSGTLRNDKNGLIDNLVNGPGKGDPSGATVFAYLVDGSGQVAFKSTVNNTTGVYSFPLAEVNSTYSLMLSTTDMQLGANPPTCGNYATVWIPVGDAYGTNNMAGTGNKVGASNSSITLTTGSTNVTNVDFGIQQLPNSDSYLAPVNQPSVNTVITLNGGINPPVLSGSDPEDCNAGCVLTTKAVIIDMVPNNAELYYNSALLTSGYLINNFNPNLLQVKITPAAMGDTSVIFSYSYVDAAMMKDPTPATYKLIWLRPLPAEGLQATAILSGDVSTVSWSTLSEQNTSHFIVERSINNKDFTQVGKPVQAAGSNAVKSSYQLADDVAGLVQQANAIYYRVKLVDIDGKTKYSNVVVVRLSAQMLVNAWPNPFHSNITISVNTDKATAFRIRMMDVSGKALQQLRKEVPKGISQINLTEFERLAAGVYLLEMTEEKSGNKTIQRLIKN